MRQASLAEITAVLSCRIQLQLLLTAIFSIALSFEFSAPMNSIEFGNSQVCENVSVSEDDLYDNYIHKTYPWQRPVRNARRPINIHVRLVLSGINEIIEREGIARLTGFLSLKWQNEVHVWNSTLPYACLDALHLPEPVTWLPELALLNSKNKYELMQSGGSEKVKIFSNGTSSYRPGGTFEVFCKFDMRHMPFDEQKVRLEFESWRYVIQYQTLSFGDPPFSTKYWIEHEQWMLVDVKWFKSRQSYLSESTYDHVTFELTIRRKSSYYWMNVILPSFFISVAQISVFGLPAGEVIKMHLSFTCLLAYGVFQVMIISDVPRSSDNIPLLSYYVAFSMAYICAAILCEGLVFMLLGMAEAEHVRAVPKRLLLYARYVAGVVLVKMPSRLQSMSSSQSQDRLRFNRPDDFQTAEEVANYRNVNDFNSIFQFAFNYNNRAADADNENDRVDGDGGEENRESGSALANGRSQLFTNMESLLAYDRDRFAAMLAAFHHHGNNSGDDERQTSQRHRRARLSKRQLQWLFLADVLERITFVGYTACTVITPLAMFGLVTAAAAALNDSSSSVI